MSKHGEEEHTPGPWVFEENIEGAIQLGVGDAWEVGSDVLKTGVALVPGRIANAHLIAAAPEMLAALKVARGCILESFDYIENYDDQIMADARLRDVDAAITKATGNSH